VNTPSYLKWVPQVSLIRWAYEGLCLNEFSDLTLTQDPVTNPRDLSSTPTAYPGSKVLATMGFSESSIKRTLLAQAGIIAFNYLFTCIVLMSQGKPRNNHITSSPSSVDDASEVTMDHKIKGKLSIQARGADEESMEAKSADEESMESKSVDEESMEAKSVDEESMEASAAGSSQSSGHPSKGRPFRYTLSRVA